MRQCNPKNKGQALILVLVMLSIVAILSAILASMWQAEIEVRDQEKNGLAAFYLAHAGIEKAKVWLKQNLTYYASSSSYDSGWVTELSTGRYDFTVSDLTNSTATLRSAGEVLDAFSSVAATRKIQVKIKNYDSSPAIVDWTWEEE